MVIKFCSYRQKIAIGMDIKCQQQYWIFRIDYTGTESGAISWRRIIEFSGGTYSFREKVIGECI